MDLLVHTETGKLLRDGLTGQWLTAAGQFVTDPALAIVFQTWKEAFSAVRKVSGKQLELVLKLHDEYQVLQVFN